MEKPPEAKTTKLFLQNPFAYALKMILIFVCVSFAQSESQNNRINEV